MKKSISFHIYKSDKFYVAEGIGVPIVTQGKTFDALAKNINEAVEVFLHEEDPKDTGIVKNPAILFSGELEAAHV